MSDYLLDTDTFIFLLKQHSKVEAKVRTVGIGRLALSVLRRWWQDGYLSRTTPSIFSGLAHTA